jgi:hypothetical protein
VAILGGTINDPRIMLPRCPVEGRSQTEYVSQRTTILRLNEICTAILEKCFPTGTAILVAGQTSTRQLLSLDGLEMSPPNRQNLQLFKAISSHDPRSVAVVDHPDLENGNSCEYTYADLTRDVEKAKAYIQALLSEESAGARVAILIEPGYTYLGQLHYSQIILNAKLLRSESVSHYSMWLPCCAIKPRVSCYGACILH